jgi:hypothetical protein
MKKTFIFILVAVCSAGTSFSQFADRLGIVSIAESDIRQCAFDPEATAVILLNEGYSSYTENNELMTYYHQKIKILKEDGIKYGVINLSYYSDNDFETIENISGVTINSTEQGSRQDIPVDEKTIYKKKLNRYRTEVSFAFPNVKVGSILDYKYRVVAKHYGGLRDWTFQDEIPVVRSTYKLTIVPGHEISYLVQYNPNYKVTVHNVKSDHAIEFEMRNIPALTNEPYMDARKDYLQKVIFQTTKYQGFVGQVSYMSNWKEVTRELMGRPDFGRQMKLNIDECQQFVATLNGKSDVEKIQSIHHFVAGNLNWNGINSLVTEDGVKNAWKKKTGNSAEINLLMINLLKDAGLEAYPMLVSERGHGKVNKEQPFINQFNNVYAVVFANNKKYYLDATDTYTPINLIPYSILNSTAFIADNHVGGLVDISENEIRYRDIVSIISKVSPEGELSGSVSVESKDYARTEKLSTYINHKSDYVDNYLKKGMINFAVDNFTTKNVEEENLPFAQAFDFKTNIQSTGEYSFLNINMFTGLENNPFIVDNRFSNVNFGYKKSLVLNYYITIPSNYKIDALPKNIKLVNSSGTMTFTRQIVPGEKGQLMAKINIDIDRSLFSVNDYPEIKSFFKQMVDLMNEQIVLKK